MYSGIISGSSVESPRVSLYSTISPKVSRKRCSAREVRCVGEENPLSPSISIKILIERKKSQKMNTKDKIYLADTRTGSDASTIKRIDAYGNIIARGKKKHKLSFRDTLGGNRELVDYIDIESFKCYNVDVSEKKGKSDNKCSCSIF